MLTNVTGTRQSSDVSPTLRAMTAELRKHRAEDIRAVAAASHIGWTRAGSRWTVSSTSKPVTTLNSEGQLC